MGFVLNLILIGAGIAVAFFIGREVLKMLKNGGPNR
jgi:hypothetical protein